MAMMNTLGKAVLLQTFQEASLVFTETDKRVERDLPYSTYYNNFHVNENKKKAFAFIKGTGLEIFIQHYNLEYDAQELRNTFFTIVEHREFIE